MPSNSVIVYWHRANQSHHWPFKSRCLAGKPEQCQFSSHWYGKRSAQKEGIKPGSAALEADTLTLAHQGDQCCQSKQLPSLTTNILSVHNVVKHHSSLEVLCRTLLACTPCGKAADLSLILRFVTDYIHPVAHNHLVAKASAPRAADLSLIPAFTRNFFPGQFIPVAKIDSPVATLPSAWHYKVSTGTGLSGVSILWRGRTESLQLLSKCGSMYNCLSRSIPEVHQHVAGTLNIEGSRPEWCISTIYHAWDTPFWSGTLDMQPTQLLLMMDPRLMNKAHLVPQVEPQELYLVVSSISSIVFHSPARNSTSCFLILTR